MADTRAEGKKFNNDDDSNGAAAAALAARSNNDKGSVSATIMGTVAWL